MMMMQLMYDADPVHDIIHYSIMMVITDEAMPAMITDEAMPAMTVQTIQILMFMMKLN